MTTWLSEHTTSPAVAPAPSLQGVDRWLRRIDAVLALLAMVVLAVPYLFARRIGELQGDILLGRAGKTFQRLRLKLPDDRAGRWLSRLGADEWPVLFNILRGDMAWVGPSPQAADIPGAMPLLTVPAGIVSLWDIRRRTAVDFADQGQADIDYLGLRGVSHDMGVLMRAAFVSIFAAPSDACPGRVRICDVEFDNVDLAQAIERIETMLDGIEPHQVSFVNPACVNIAAQERGYRRSLARASLVLPDGIGTKIAADILGTPLRQNVNGTDLFPRLCDRLDARSARLFLLGGQPGVPQRVAAEIQARWPRIQIVGVRDGFFQISDEGTVAAEVRSAQPDVLMVARGVPMQDIFIDRYLHHLGAKVSLGVGGLFDFVSGRISRAPRWMRESGLEWVYRLMQEPGRMWQRYLVGNVTFLARVVLQRLRLRHEQLDTEPAQALAPLVPAAPVAALGDVVGVLFATTCAASDIPVFSDHPACLLPYGPTTFLERCITQFAQAGIRHVHMVTATRPDLLRQALGNGDAWGVRLSWHLVKDDHEAPRVLRYVRLEPHQRAILGQAHKLLSASTFAKLMAHDLAACVLPEGSQRDWAGWTSLSAEGFRELTVRAAEESLEMAVARTRGPWLLLQPGDCDAADTAAALLSAQASALQSDLSATLADPVIKMPWGAMSPSARVASSARIIGPAWVGPGCTVGANAELGANSVLTRDVIVGEDTRLLNALVLPETIVGQWLDLQDAIANGSSMQHVVLRGRIELNEADGVMSRLHTTSLSARLMRFAGQVLASALLPVLAPVLLGVVVVRQSKGQPALPWTREPAVVSQDAMSGRLKLLEVRIARPRLGPVAAAAAAAGAMLDIAGGRRYWLGIRPRTAQEWHRLPHEWQALLVTLPIGWLHMAAWTDLIDTSTEARAAADLMWMDPPRGLKRLTFFAQALPAAIQPTRH